MKSLKRLKVKIIRDSSTQFVADEGILSVLSPMKDIKVEDFEVELSWRLTDTILEELGDFPCRIGFGVNICYLETGPFDYTRI